MNESDSDKRVFLSTDEAIAMLPAKEAVHTFIQSVGGILIGADWSMSKIRELLSDPKSKPELSGPTAAKMNHGMVCIYENTYLFIETREMTNEPL